MAKLAFATPVFIPPMRVIIAATNANPMMVTTSLDGVNPFPHGYSNGLIVRIDIPRGYGMQQANGLTGEILVNGLNTFLINIDSTLFDTFSFASSWPFNEQYAQCVPIAEDSATLANAVQNVLPYITVPSDLVLSLTDNSGVSVGATYNNINIIGKGNVVVSGDNTSNTLTISDSGSVGINWVVVSAASANLAPNTGYIANRGSNISFALPTTCPLGSFIRITNRTTALGFTIAQAAGQQIFFGTSSTTLGAGGSLSSSAAGDSLELLCVAANTTFQVLSSIGNLTIA